MTATGRSSSSTAARSAVFTRNGYDWSERYQPVIVAGAMLNCDRAIIDGEMIVQDENGRSDFGALAGAIRRAPKRLVFFAFDLLHLDGKDFRPETTLESRSALSKRAYRRASSDPVQRSLFRQWQGVPQGRR